MIRGHTKQGNEVKSDAKIKLRFLQWGNIASHGFGGDLSYRFDYKQINVCVLRISIFNECLLDYMFYNFKTNTTSPMKNEKRSKCFNKPEKYWSCLLLLKRKCVFFLSGSHRTSSKLTKRCPLENAVMPG